MQEEGYPVLESMRQRGVLSLIQEENCRESLRKCYVHNSSFLSCSIHPLSLRLHVTCIVGHFKPFKLSKKITV